MQQNSDKLDKDAKMIGKHASTTPVTKLNDLAFLLTAVQVSLKQNSQVLSFLEVCGDVNFGQMEWINAAFGSARNYGI